MMSTTDQKIRQLANDLGFDAIGFTKNFAPEHSEYFLDWLKSGKHGEMAWLARNTDRRLAPNTLLKACRSAIVLAVSYNHEANRNAGFKIARYAHGEDYHIWMKQRLERLAEAIRATLMPDFSWRSFVDTGPVLERDLVAKAGLGWVGKNTCLINEDLGSFVFLGVIFCNMDFPNSAPVADQCATCTLCIEACPTDALAEYQMDAGKCLAYHNIEKRGERDPYYAQKMGEWLVGCDICQEVCPWNQNAPLTRNQEWLGSFEKFRIGDLNEALMLTETDYNDKFAHSAISRIRYEDFRRNVVVVMENS